MDTRTPKAKMLFGFIAFAMLLSACSSKDSAGTGKGGDRKAEPPVPVVEARVVQKTVPEQIRAIGNVEAYSTVSVKCRVDGEILSVHFREGDAVRAGQLLFTIDPRPFQAQLDQARANLARDRAQLDNARAQERRYAELLEKGFVSKEMYAQIRTNAAAAAAVTQGDDAAVENAGVLLAYSSIRSPLDGVAGSLQMHAGNLVKANDTGPLVVINQISPIRVTFSVPEQYLSRIRHITAQGVLAVEAVPSRSGGAAERGRLSFIENTVDTSTGTIKLKGTFDNRSRTLWPGQFADVVLTLSEQHDALVVPSQAVQTGPEGSYVYVIRPDLSAELRRVTADRAGEGEAIVRSGLKAGERVVVDGQLRIRPGSKVVPKPAL